MQEKTCCFFGHREIKESQALRQKVSQIIEEMIVCRQVDAFLFGSKSQFNCLCYEETTKLKEKYPYIKRIYIRAEFAEINEGYQNYLLEQYEETYYPPKAAKAGRAAYVERNYEMINKSGHCVVYFHKDCLPKDRKSGTQTALDYAVKKNRKLIILP